MLLDRTHVKLLTTLATDANFFSLHFKAQALSTISWWKGHSRVKYIKDNIRRDFLNLTNHWGKEGKKAKISIISKREMKEHENYVMLLKSLFQSRECKHFRCISKMLLYNVWILRACQKNLRWEIPSSHTIMYFTGDSTCQNMTVNVIVRVWISIEHFLHLKEIAEM